MTRGLHEIELAGATGPVDADDLLERALAMVPEVPGWSEVRLFVALTTAPRQTVLRPVELDAPALAEDLKRMALFGENRVLDVRTGTEAEVRGHVLSITQTHAAISLSEEGSISLDVPLYDRAGRRPPGLAPQGRACGESERDPDADGGAARAGPFVAPATSAGHDPAQSGRARGGSDGADSMARAPTNSSEGG